MYSREALYSAHLSMLIYCIPESRLQTDSISVKDFLDNHSYYLGDAYQDTMYQRSFEQINSYYLKNPMFGEVILSQFSWNMEEYNSGTIAMLAVDEEGTNYVVYRGTEDGEWFDNRYCISGINSPQQMEAMDYFDRLCKENTFSAADRIIATGHSKGANKATYITFCSENGICIDQCYAYDGPGYSSEAIAYMKQQYGEEYYVYQRNKILAINGENDYVHVLTGEEYLLEEQTHYVKTTRANSFVSYHEISYLFEDGMLGERSEPREIALYMKDICFQIAKLSERERANIGMAMMYFLERIMGNQYQSTGIHQEYTSSYEWDSFARLGVPGIALSTAKNEQMYDIRNCLSMNIVRSVHHQFGLDGILGAASMISLGTLISIETGIQRPFFTGLHKEVFHYFDFYATMENLSYVNLQRVIFGGYFVRGFSKQMISMYPSVLHIGLYSPIMQWNIRQTKPVLQGDIIALEHVYDCISRAQDFLDQVDNAVYIYIRLATIKTYLSQCLQLSKQCEQKVAGIWAWEDEYE